MACMSCVFCNWSGNEAVCPNCGSPCLFDERIAEDANETGEEDSNGEENEEESLEEEE